MSKDTGKKKVDVAVEAEGEHHHGAEALSEKLEANDKARSWIMRSVVIFLIVVFFAGLAWGAGDLLSREGQFPPKVPLDDTITHPPEAVDVIYDIVQASYADALARKPKLKLETKFDFGNDKDQNSDRYKYVNTIEFTSPGADSAELERLTATLRFLGPSLCEYLHTAILERDADGAGSALWDTLIEPEKPQDISPARETQYGEDFSRILWALPGDSSEIESVGCGYIYYRCSACGKEEDSPKDVCPDCKAKGTMLKSYRDNYTLTLRLAEGAPQLDALFHMPTPEQAAALLGDQLDDLATVESLRLECRNARVEADVNRLTKDLKGLRFKRDIAVTAQLLLHPAFSPAGNVTAQFTLGENTNFGLIWPGVSLSAHERVMNTRENSQLTAKFDSPWGQETPKEAGTKTEWVSSDPAICEVDQEGYLKSGREFGEAVITLSFELDGKTYSDQCAISVKVPVEKAKLSHRSLKLEAGQETQLQAKISPSRATYKDVTWHSDDPAVATVDESGLVTALAPGEASVYALTQDGYYRASCAVTVTGGGE